MRILQVLTTISFGDAVSNDTMAIHRSLERQGYQTGIYSENIDQRLLKNSFIFSVDNLNVSPEDVIIYHMSTGTKLNYSIAGYPGKKIMIYHNITPPEFFKPYSDIAYNLCNEGRKSLEFLKDKFDYVIGDSQYNVDELKEIGFDCPMKVLPILIPFEDYEKKPNAKVIKKYQDDGFTNILFTGRIAPNKKQEDVINAFFHYKKYYNKNSRLILVGNSQGMESYYQRLEDYIEALGVEDVIFPGHIPFDHILAYYTIADLFLCMSEHEGFCVPLVEAMKFETPIIAYDSCAVPETLGAGGLVVAKKNPIETAGLIDYVVNNKALQDNLLANQKKRLDSFSHEVVEQQFVEYLADFMENHYEQ